MNNINKRIPTRKQTKITYTEKKTFDCYLKQMEYTKQPLRVNKCTYQIREIVVHVAANCNLVYITRDISCCCVGLRLVYCQLVTPFFQREVRIDNSSLKL